MKDFNSWVNDMSTEGWNEEPIESDVKIVDDSLQTELEQLRDKIAKQMGISDKYSFAVECAVINYKKANLALADKEEKQLLSSNKSSQMELGLGYVNVTQELKDQIIKEYKIELIKKAKNFIIGGNKNIYFNSVGAAIFYNTLADWQDDDRYNYEVISQWLKENE